MFMRNHVTRHLFIWVIITYFAKFLRTIKRDEGDDVYDNSTTSKKEFVQFLESLTNSQFEKIQKFFEGTPRLEHKFTVMNPNTGEPSEFIIQGLSNFFG